MYQSVEEPIDAYVLYKRGASHPILRSFRWGTRRFDVTATNLVHPEREGQTVFICYAVSCGGNNFRIRLNTNRCLWILDAIDVEG
jgi:hypothetical protein